VKRNCIIGCAALVLTLCGASANAQRNNELMRNWDVRMGFFIPERESSRAAEGDVWFTLGVDRTVYTADRLKVSMSVDYYGSGSLYNVPVLLNLRHETHKIRLFAGAGIGVSHDMTEGKTGFAYNLGIGYDMSSAITFDVRYIGLSTGAYHF
jgi:hypothetical protein